jgi:hypothetical protein
MYLPVWGRLSLVESNFSFISTSLPYIFITSRVSHISSYFSHNSTFYPSLLQHHNSLSSVSSVIQPRTQPQFSLTISHFSLISTSLPYVFITSRVSLIPSYFSHNSTFYPYFLLHHNSLSSVSSMIQPHTQPQFGPTTSFFSLISTSLPYVIITSQFNFSAFIASVTIRHFTQLFTTSQQPLLSFFNDSTSHATLVQPY